MCVSAQAWTATNPTARPTRWFTLPSTPPPNSRRPHLESFSPDTVFHPTPHGIAGYFPDQFAATGAYGLKEDVWLSEPIAQSPTSPSTIGSTAESQAGGYFPPTTSSDTSEEYTRGRSLSQPQPPRRHNLSLSIPAYPPPGNPSQISPSSLASSGAPFTDSFSVNNSYMATDYFYLDDSAFPPSAGVDQQPQPPQHQSQQQQQHISHTIQPNIFRQPASQPSSPVRGVFPQGQGAFVAAGRARGATFSGASQNFDFTQFQQPLHQQPSFASAVPHHLTFTSIPSPSASPASASPLVASAPAIAPAISRTLTPLEEGLTPLAAQRLPVPSTSDQDMSMEMVDKLTLLDRIVNNAQMAKQALLRGQEVEVSANLSVLSTNLEVASELGVGPAQTPRDTPSSSVSPPNQFSTSPTVQTLMPIAPSALLPALPVDNSSATLRRISPTAPTTTFLSTPDYNPAIAPPQAPPLTHSHSFPNGHQLPSQVSGIAAPTTPIVPSPSFAAAIGIGHAPVVSSPLTAMPVSRAPSPPHSYPQPDFGTEEILSDAGPPSRRPSEARPDGRPVINRSRSASVNKTWSSMPNMTAAAANVAATAPPSAWQSRQGSPEEDGEDESEDDAPRKTKRRRSSVTKEDAPDMGYQLGSIISDDIRRQLDQIFEEFLNMVCSDLEITDAKGEKLHQVLMPKKMQRLDESTDYRPFKFRIQAFTNAFHDELLQRGITEDTMSAKKVKMYLWKQDLISRFNADGKKAKSKGNHIWNVEAKKMPGGGWVFRPFKRRIMGQPNAFALVNQQYEWEPRIWDPQAASDTLKPVFRSPPGALPPWLHWEDDAKLVGTPTEPSAPITITAIAEFIDSSGSKCILDTSFNIQAVLPHLMPLTDPQAIYAQAQVQAAVQAQVMHHHAQQAQAQAQANVQAQMQQQQAAAASAYGAQTWTSMDPNMINGQQIMQPVFTMNPNMAYAQPTYHPQ